MKYGMKIAQYILGGLACHGGATEDSNDQIAGVSHARSIYQGIQPTRTVMVRSAPAIRSLSGKLVHCVSYEVNDLANMRIVT